MTFSKLTTLFWGTSLLLLVPILSFSANIAVIESQSNHPMQNMDSNWEMVITNLGHTATILQQSALDDLSSLDAYDILVLSSGLIDLPMNRRATVKAFFNSGKNMYLQSEYLLIHPGNMMFAEIVTEYGNEFVWEGETSGSVAPMNVVCSLGNNLNTVTQLPYFWYGTYGTGDESVIPFLESNDKSYGYTYSPEGMGRVITTTDQDWIRTLTSEELMENIVYMLTESNNTSANQPTVEVALIDPPVCENGTYNFTTTVENPTNGLFYQWQINGQSIANATNTSYTSSDLSEGDVVECVILMDQDCEMYSHISNPILIAPILPLSDLTLEINTTQSGNCQGEETTFSTTITSESTYNVIAYQWQINNSDVPGADQADFTTTALNNNDIVICNIQYSDACSNFNLASSNEITTSLEALLTPTASIIATTTSACQGQDLTFEIEGEHLGAQPTFQWLVNGSFVGTNSNTLTINNLEDGQQISCAITSSYLCLTTDQVVTNPVAVSISNMEDPTLAINVSETSVCEEETVTFTASGDNWGDNPFFTWTINGQSTGDNEPVLSINNLKNNDEVACAIYLSSPCVNTTELETVAESVIIMEGVTPVISISADEQAICKGSEVTFTANIQNGGSSPSIEWMIDETVVSNNTSTFSTNQLSNGQIVSCKLTSNADCVSTSEVSSNLVSISVSEITLIVNQQNDDYCGMGNGKIQVGVNYAIGEVAYLWNTGSTEKTLRELPAGAYSVTATDALGCSATLSIQLEETISLEIEKLESFDAGCSGTEGFAAVHMKDQTKTYFYTWMTENGNILGDEQTVRSLAPGKYIVEITDETDCFVTEEFIIDGSAAISLEMEQQLMTNWGDQTKLEPTVTGTGDLTFEWFPAEGLSCTDCPNPIFSAETESEYSLTVTNNEGCSITKSIRIQVRKSHDVFIPTAFSPNGDGQNDFFIAFGGDKVRSIKAMTVADRWGNILFKKQDVDVNDELAGWDGTSRGQQLNVGVYIYTMEVEFVDGRVRSFGGDVTLAR
ncbi:MAG: gliding motility-associated C-terminal domain-containing protein [Saprospiraceae bacterium]